jgi:transposase
MEVTVDWRAKVELFEQMRREYEHGEGTIRGVARKFGVHRRMVREALASSLPARRKAAERACPKLGAVKDFIDAILESDRKAPRKQRHTAHRIHQRLKAELPHCDVSESTVRRYVGKRKHAMGCAARETFVPQSYDWGVEAQADWYEAEAELEGERCTLQVFSLRSMASGAAFHRAYRRATQQAFLEGHEWAFRYFGGVFRQVRYDNLKSAVKKILRGYQREETARFIAFRSHWGFTAEFCNPGRGNEKGGVEGEIGYFRRNHWTPVPQAHSLEELNQFLEAACCQDEGRHIQGREACVGAALVLEREHLLPLPGEGFELVETSFPEVDTKGCVKVRMNRYSVPVKAGTRVQVKAQPAAIEVWQDGTCIARHERCYERGQQILNLEHYLEVLERKPGALAGSTPLAQWREQGRWPASFDRLWQELMRRQGKAEGTRQMIRLLQLGKAQGYAKLQTAAESALAWGCGDEAAVRYLLLTAPASRPPQEALEVGWLDRYARPQPQVNEYDQLLAAEVQR